MTGPRRVDTTAGGDPPPQPPEQPPPPPPAQPPPQPPAQQPPPPPPGTGIAAGEPKAGGGARALGVLLALVLLIGGAILVIFAINPDNTPRCDDLAAALRAGECRDLGSAQETVATIVAWIGGVVAAVGIVAALAFTFTGRQGRRAVTIAVAAVVLGVITIAITHG